MLKSLLCLSVCVVVLAGCASNSTGPDARTANAPTPAPTTSPTAEITSNLILDPSADPVPQWIWGPDEPKAGEDRYFRVTFDPGLPAELKTENPSSAWLWAAGDDEMTVYLNNKRLIDSKGWNSASVVDIRGELTAGENVLAIKVTNTTGPAGLALKMEVKPQGREMFRLVSDGTWTSTTQPGGRWRERNDRGASGPTVASRVIGAYGIPPWNKLPIADPPKATPVENITLPPGFKAELIYSVPKFPEGSWVTMTPDPKGRLYVSDQNGPLYRVTPSSGTTPTKVEKVPVEIGMAQGMLWTWDSLYVVVNSRDAKPKSSGLYRLRDTDGDDKLDEVTLLKEFKDRNNRTPASGEHGPHAVVRGPDDMLYVIAGNFTNLPDGLAPTSPAKNWNEDILNPRMPDGRGHDPTIMAPGGWLCRTDRDGKTWEAYSVGMRNTYDFAFNHDGEMFGFDSDMEWDIGAPWYRPTRVFQLVSGAEYGWRNGSGKWPTYYPDSLPGVVDIGLSSPTGVNFGYGAKFPAKFQRALYVADWAYGKIFAVHLEPKGAGYTATSEPFIVGKPFAVTDCVINTDGAMYVTIGGRGTQSGLYRITYEGSESTEPISGEADKRGYDARMLRRQLEKFHGHRDPLAVSFAWPHLSSEDRHIRFAARVAIEAQDPSQWTERALNETSPTASINALLAVCRTEQKALQPRVLEALGRLNLSKLTTEQVLEALRVYGMCFLSLGEPDDAMRNAVIAKLDPLFPSGDANVTHELCELLVYLKSPTVVAKSMHLLEAAPTQETQIFYAFKLRNTTQGWTPDTRRAYFAWCDRAEEKYTGGASFKIFLKNTRAESLKTMAEGEKIALGLTSSAKPSTAPSAGAIPAKKFVRKWQMIDLTPKLEQTKAGRSFENGKLAYSATSCAQCHRFAGDGGATGPDITGVGQRFQAADVLEAIILPSKVISDQYQATEIITKKQGKFFGTVKEEDEEKVVLQPSPLATFTETIKKTDITERRPSKLSVMPEGLIDVLSEEEILDLVAYLRSGGNPKDPAFQKPQP